MAALISRRAHRVENRRPGAAASCAQQCRRNPPRGAGQFGARSNREISRCMRPAFGIPDLPVASRAISAEGNLSRRPDSEVFGATCRGIAGRWHAVARPCHRRRSSRRKSCVVSARLPASRPAAQLARRVLDDAEPTRSRDAAVEFGCHGARIGFLALTAAAAARGTRAACQRHHGISHHGSLRKMVWHCALYLSISARISSTATKQ